MPNVGSRSRSKSIRAAGWQPNHLILVELREILVRKEILGRAKSKLRSKGVLLRRQRLGKEEDTSNQTNQIKSNQIKSNQIKSGQARYDQFDYQVDQNDYDAVF